MKKKDIRKYVSMFFACPTKKWDKIEASWNRSLVLGCFALPHLVAGFVGQLILMVIIDFLFVYLFIFVYLVVAKGK